MLELLDRHFEKRGNHWYTLYVCFCGNLTITRPDRVRIGKTRSCGCLKQPHGMHAHPLSKVFIGMKQRCYNPNTESYKNYGARGIYVCNEWLDNSGTFIEWALVNGWELGLTIDRIDNNGPYSPSNCRFVPRYINCQNTRRIKLNPAKAAQIRYRIKRGDSFGLIANIYNVSVATIYNIASGKIWKTKKEEICLTK